MASTFTSRLEEGTVAHRKDGFNKAVVFTEYPIKIGELFEVKIEDILGDPSHAAVLLDPPIIFGPQHIHRTRRSEHFTNLDRCRDRCRLLSFTQSFFCYRASQWWNQLPDH